MNDNACLVAILVLIFCCILIYYGEPDLHDAIIDNLMCEKQIQNTPDK